MTPTVTFIIPVYNVEAYLRECLDSVLSQTSPHWQCIIVDDCSTDSSSKIIEEYLNTDRRFSLISHTENRRQAAARNTGLKRADTSHIAFLDSDDVLATDFVTNFMNVNSQADITSFGFKSGITPNFNPSKKTKNKNIQAKDALMSMLYQRKEFNASVCGKVYSRHLFDDVRFTDGILYEDIDIMHRLLLKADNVCIVNAVGYFYRQRPGSTLHTWSRRRLDVLDVTQRICSRLKEDPALYTAACDRHFAAAYNMLLLLRRNGLGKSADASRCRAILRQLSPAIMRNSKSRPKNRLGAGLFRLIHIIN